MQKLPIPNVTNIFKIIFPQANSYATNKSYTSGDLFKILLTIYRIYRYFTSYITQYHTYTTNSYLIISEPVSTTATPSTLLLFYITLNYFYPPLHIYSKNIATFPQTLPYQIFHHFKIYSNFTSFQYFQRTYPF